MKDWPTNGVGDINDVLPNTLLSELLSDTPPTSYMAFCTQSQYDILVNAINALNNVSTITNFDRSNPVTTFEKSVLRINSTAPSIYNRSNREKKTFNADIKTFSKLTFSTSLGSTKFFTPENGNVGDVYLYVAATPYISGCTTTTHYLYLNDVAQFGTQYKNASADPNCPSYYTFLGNSSDYSHALHFGIIRFNDTYRINHASVSALSEFLLLRPDNSSSIDITEHDYITQKENVLRKMILEEDIPDTTILSLKNQVMSLQKKIDGL